MLYASEINKRALGNAIWTYATLFGVGKKTGFDIRIPKGKNHTHIPTGQSIIQLTDIFDIKTPYITEEEIKNIKYTFTEGHKGFNKEIFDIKNNTNLIGFLQNEGYYSHCIPQLREELKIKNKWLNLAKEKLNKLGLRWNNYFNDFVSLHIRRGDYTQPHLQQFHPLLPLEYYNKAINIILSKNSYKKFLIFSDDKEYCKKYFNKDPYYIIDNSEFLEYDAVMDFAMMTLCGGGSILANSTFSYWAAWIANNKTTIYPSVFLGPGYNNYNPISNKEWIKI